MELQGAFFLRPRPQQSRVDSGSTEKRGGSQVNSNPRKDKQKQKNTQKDPVKSNDNGGGSNGEAWQKTSDLCRPR